MNVIFNGHVLNCEACISARIRYGMSTSLLGQLCYGDLVVSMRISGLAMEGNALWKLFHLRHTEPATQGIGPLYESWQSSDLFRKA
jgi:hypothetical protein